MRHLLLLLVLTLSGCSSTNWFGWQRSEPAICDDSSCSECLMEPAGAVSLDPAPIFQRPMTELPIIGSPMIEGTFDQVPVPDALPDMDFGSTAEPVPTPEPDPAT